MKKNVVVRKKSKNNLSKALEGLHAKKAEHKAGIKGDKKLHKMAVKRHKEDKLEKVMHEFKEGKLHAGSKKGPKVSNRKQAIAIALSEAKKGKK